jgi:hypothetical protein
MIDQHLSDRLYMCPPSTSSKKVGTDSQCDSRHGLSHLKSTELKRVLERIAPLAREKLLQRAVIRQQCFKQRFSNHCDTHHQIDQSLLAKCPLHERFKGKIEVTLKRKSQTAEERFLSVIVRMLHLVTLSGHLISHHSVLHARLEPLCLSSVSVVLVLA